MKQFLLRPLSRRPGRSNLLGIGDHALPALWGLGTSHERFFELSGHLLDEVEHGLLKLLGLGRKDLFTSHETHIVSGRNNIQVRTDRFAHAPSDAVPFHGSLKHFSGCHKADLRWIGSALPGTKGAKRTIKRPPFYRQPRKVLLVSKPGCFWQHASMIGYYRAFFTAMAFRPFARLRESTFVPPFVLMRARNPWVLARWRFFGWNVLLGIFVQGIMPRKGSHGNSMARLSFIVCREWKGWVQCLDVRLLTNDKRT